MGSWMSGRYENDRYIHGSNLRSIFSFSEPTLRSVAAWSMNGLPMAGRPSGTDPFRVEIPRTFLDFLTHLPFMWESAECNA